MENIGHGIKKVLFAMVLVVLLLPLIQQHANIFESEPLAGYSSPAEKSWFSVDGWMNGSYQEAHEKWFNENFGFRPELIRIYNQIAYSLYRDAKANGAVIGKDEYLYELNYILTYNGEDFVGMPSLTKTTEMLKVLQDSLEKRNITLLVCLAPGKASYYPEYIPDGYGKGSDTTSYKMLAQQLIEKNINHIDYNKWFMEMKSKSPYVLYPRTGIHWSRYGSTLAADSLIKYVERKRNVDMPDLIIDRVVVSDSLREPDDDIALALNLFCPPEGLPMGYPEFHFEDTTGKAKVKMMTIGDSFFWSLFDMSLAPGSFEEIYFSYYNAQLYKWDRSPMVVADIATSMETVERSDVIMIIATECTLWEFGWGFIAEAFDNFVAHKMVASVVKLIAKYEAVIRNDPKWLEAVRKKAAEQGRTLDEMIYLDARFMAEQEVKRQESPAP